MPMPFQMTVFPGKDALARAFAALPQDERIPAVLRLAPGVYREKLLLTRGSTTIEGAGADSTRIVYGDGAYDPHPDGRKRGTFRSATLTVLAKDVTLRALTVENDAAPREKAGQAIALFADGDRFTAEDVTLLSFQDTLFTAPLPPKEVLPDGFLGPTQFAPRTPQRQIYRRCRIRGDIDFIFGGAAAWFEACDIVSTDGRADRTAPCAGYAAAACTPEGQRFGYVFHRCRFLSEGLAAQSAYLGRPWREFAKTVLLRCEIGAHIRPEGFHDWDKPDFPEKGYFAEYRCTGPGVQGPRAPFVHALTDEQAAQYTQEALMESL